MTHRRSIFVILLLTFAFSGCKKNSDITPSWLQIDTINLTSILATEGEASHGIVDAWVYMDGNALGVFELPCKIPILDEGEHSFIIWAGIKQNGISATRVRYPFYEKWEGDLTLTKSDTVTINPTVKYKEDLVFSLMEDFEDSGIDFVKNPESDTNLIFIEESMYPSIVQWGDKCGGLFLSTTDSVYKATTNLEMNLPLGGQPVYLEIDYMNTNSITMGVIAENGGGVAEHGPLVLMNSQEAGSEVWRKIYINLTDDVSFEINATSFEIYLLSILDSENTTGIVYLDNMKIVHY